MGRENALVRANRIEAVRARVVGVPFDELATRYGVSEVVVRAWVSKALHARHDNDVEELRAIEAAGLDKLEAGAWERIRKNPDDETYAKLAATVLRIKERRTNLLGLDRPVVVEHRIAVRRDHDAELEVLVAELTGGGVLQSQPEDLYIDGEIVE